MPSFHILNYGLNTCHRRREINTVPIPIIIRALIVYTIRAPNPNLANIQLSIYFKVFIVDRENWYGWFVQEKKNQRCIVLKMWLIVIHQPTFNKLLTDKTVFFRQPKCIISPRKTCTSLINDMFDFICVCNCSFKTGSIGEGSGCAYTIKINSFNDYFSLIIRRVILRCSRLSRILTII